MEKENQINLIEPTSDKTDNFKELADNIISLQKQHQTFVEKIGADVQSLKELKQKTESEDKLARAPDHDAQLKKMTEKLNELEDKYKTEAMKRNAEKNYRTVDGLVGKLPDKMKGKEAFARSILEDPHAKEYKKAFFNRLMNVKDLRSAQELEDVVQKIKDSSHSVDDSFVKKSLTTIVGNQSGYLVPPEFDLDIIKTLFETSPLRQVASSKMTNRASYIFPIRTSLPAAAWGNTELASIDDTNEQEYGEGRIDIHELWAYPNISLNNLEDSAVNIEQELKEDIKEAFMLAENKAFIVGNGVERPHGLEYYAKKSNASVDVKKPLRMQKISVAQSDLSSKLADALLDLEAAVFAGHKRMGAYYLINRSVKNTIRQLKDGNNQYLFSTSQGWGSFQGVPSISDGVSGRINGYPILECDDLPAATSGNYPIYFGNFSKYCVIDRIGMKLIRDEITKKGYVRFFFRKRLGAGLKLAQGIKTLNVT